MILYFTGTGNCLYVARELAAEGESSPSMNAMKVMPRSIGTRSARRRTSMPPIYLPASVKLIFSNGISYCVTAKETSLILFE